MKTETVYKHRIRTVSILTKEPTKGYNAVSSSKVAADIAQGIFNTLDCNQEHFVILCLDSANKVQAFKVIHSGGMAFCQVDPRIVFTAALLLGAAGIIVVHNHPSGYCSPSSDDFAVIAQLKKASELLGIALLDSLIVGGDAYYSFADNSQMGGF